jgi:hypothetical protein
LKGQKSFNHFYHDILYHKVHSFLSALNQELESGKILKDCGGKYPEIGKLL